MFIIRNAKSIIQSAHKVCEGIDILIGEGRILAMGKNLSAPDAEPIDADGCIVSPGFVNLHTHLYQSMLKGMRDDLPLAPWCDAVTFPFIGALAGQENRREIFRSFGMLGAIEQLRSGVTAFVDMDMSSPALTEAWRTLGVRGVMAAQTANRWVPEALLQPDETQLDKLSRLIERTGTDGLCIAALAPSTPFCCTEIYLRKLSDLAQETGVRLFIHAAETRVECEESRRDTGLTPVAYLHRIGFLSERVTAVHCVHVTQDEIAMLKDSGCTVCHCPKSNAKLGSGIAPVRRMLDAGITPALGTDGAASNDLLDMFEEMRAAALLQRALHGSDALSAVEAFAMATEHGARALGLNAGVLEPGKAADLFLLDARGIGMTPAHDALRTLVWCGRAENVRTVFVNGQPVLLDNRVQNVDEAAELRRAEKLENECRKAVLEPAGRI